MALSPEAWIALGSAGVGATSAYLNSRSRSRDREQERELAEQAREDQRGSNLLDVASRESLADPFRHQVSQGSALAMLDRIANAQRKPTQINVPPEMARYMVTRPEGSGYSYEASPDLRAAAKLLQRDISSGRGAPTQTNPANYGMTGAVNLNDPSSIGRPPAAVAPTTPGTGGGAVPRHPGAAGTPTSPFPPITFDATDGDDDDSVFDDADDFYSSVIPEYERRGKRDSSKWDTAGSAAITGSAVAGPYAPVVAGVGALMKAFGRTAQTAPTDFDLANAQDIYRRAGEFFLDPDNEREEPEITDEELDAAIRSQGWEPGDRWVGEKGLFQIINQLAASDEAKARKRRQQQTNAELTPSYSGLFT